MILKVISLECEKIIRKKGILVLLEQKYYVMLCYAKLTYFF